MGMQELQFIQRIIAIVDTDDDKRQRSGWAPNQSSGRTDLPNGKIAESIRQIATEVHKMRQDSEESKLQTLEMNGSIKERCNIYAPVK